MSDAWQFRIDNEEIAFSNLSLHEALRRAAQLEAAIVSGQSGSECAHVEFNASHAVVLYMGSERVVLRPYFPDAPVEDDRLARFFCGGCGIFEGPVDEYLACFLSRSDGIELFEAVVRESRPITMWIRSADDHTQVSRAIEWRPLPGIKQEVTIEESEAAPKSWWKIW